MHPICCSTSILFLIIIFVSVDSQPIVRYDDKKFKKCSLPSECGPTNSTSHSYCGRLGFELNCKDKFTLIEIKSENNSIFLPIYQGQIPLAQNDICSDIFVNDPSSSAPSDQSLTFLFNCSLSPSRISNNSTCTENGFTNKGFYVEESHKGDLIKSCQEIISVPFRQVPLEHLPEELKSKKTVLKYVEDFEFWSSCVRSQGDCGYDWHTKEHICFYRRSEKNKLALPVGLGVGGSGILIIFILSIFFIKRRYKRKYSSPKFLSSNNLSDPSSKSELEGGSMYFGVHIFSHSELEEATNNFNSEKELGDGGFGIVYHGKLRDGREVAVKRLFEQNYRRVEQFLNEIEILTRLRHKNLVTLYGCTSRRSRDLLLVYEYIPNGTVADHLHGERAKPNSLTWSVRMNIAIETASALAYLHASDTIHRDVKTTNILLDNNYSVKVADFGLSRLFPNDVTHVSTAPQGTPGYVDPEYHQCYQLTDRSDVYSFGVVLIELISSMPAVDITRHRHEINLANLAINRIQKCAFDELIDSCLGYQSDEEIRRMTTSVAELAFRCLQQDKEMRPSMDEVLEELQRIQSGGYKLDNIEEHENNDVMQREVPPPSPAECDAVSLLKNIRLPPPSPISVTDKWISSNTTPNASG